MVEFIPFPRYSEFYFGWQTESFERGFNDRNQEPYGCKKVTRILNFPTDSCCVDSTPGLKSITVNKWKLNNKHTQRTQEFTWFGKLPTSTETTKKFHYKKIGRYNSAQEHSQETQIPIHPNSLSPTRQENTILLLMRLLLGFLELLSSSPSCRIS